MRSRKTTRLLLILAFLFILTVIILCLLPVEKKSPQKDRTKYYKGYRKPIHSTTTEASQPPPSTTYITSSTASTTTSTTEEETRPPIVTTPQTTTTPVIVTTTTAAQTTTTAPTPTTTITQETTSPIVTTHKSTERTPTYVGTHETTSTTETLTTTTHDIYETTSEETTSLSKTTTSSTYSDTTFKIIEDHQSLTTTPLSTTQRTSFHTTEQESYSTTLVDTTTSTVYSSTTEETVTDLVNTTSEPPSTSELKTTEESYSYTPSESSETSETTTNYTGLIEYNEVTNYTTYESTPTSTSTPFSSTSSKIISTILSTTTTLSSSSTETTPMYTDTTEAPFKLYREEGGVCASVECKDLASKMLDSLNHAVDPCQDFYEYSCGGVETDPFLQPEDPEVYLDFLLKDQLPLYEYDALTFYKSCMNSHAIRVETFYPPAWLKSPSSRDWNNWPSRGFTSLVSSLLKMDLPLLFDVVVDIDRDSKSLTFVPRITLPEYDSPIVLHSYKTNCLHALQEQIKDEHKSGMVETQLDKYNGFYVDCLNGKALDQRMANIRTAVKEFGLDMGESESPIFLKLREFISKLNKLLLSLSPNSKPKIKTLRDLKRDPRISILMDWNYFFEELLGYKLEDSQIIYFDHFNVLTKFFSNLHRKFKPSEMQRIMLMLAAEQILSKTESTEVRSKFCFQKAKKLLPDDFLLMFLNSFEDEEIDHLSEEIKNLGQAISTELVTLTSLRNFAQPYNSLLRSHTSVEFLNFDSILDHIHNRKEKVKLNNDYSTDVLQLQKYYRKNMLSLLRRENLQEIDCKFLPKELHTLCYIKLGQVRVPLEQLVPPNYYVHKKMPNYLRLAGVAHFIARVLTHNVTEEELNIGGYLDSECLKKEIPTSFNVTNQFAMKSSYEVKDEHLRNKSYSEFRAFNVAWRAIRNLSPNDRSGDISETIEMPLAWIEEEGSLKPLKAFVLRKAQGYCQSSKEFDIFRAVRYNEPPSFFWINTLIRNDPLFSEALDCNVTSAMSLSSQCKTEVSETDFPWVNIDTTTPSFDINKLGEF